MGVNKVDFGGNTLIDLTNDTVTADTLYLGVTAHGADGEQVIGALNMDNYYTKSETEQLIEDNLSEMGQYIDFHNTANDNKDYSTRLLCDGDYENIVNLPSSTGTLTIGDKAYKIVTSSVAPTTTDTSIITIVI